VCGIRKVTLESKEEVLLKNGGKMMDQNGLSRQKYGQLVGKKKRVGHCLGLKATSSWGKNPHARSGKWGTEVKKK